MQQDHYQLSNLFRMVQNMQNNNILQNIAFFRERLSFHIYGIFIRDIKKTLFPTKEWCTYPY